MLLEPRPASWAEVRPASAPAFRAATASVLRSPISVLVRPLIWVLVSAPAWAVVRLAASDEVRAASWAEVRPVKAVLSIAAKLLEPSPAMAAVLRDANWSEASEKTWSVLSAPASVEVKPLRAASLSVDRLVPSPETPLVPIAASCAEVIAVT